MGKDTAVNRITGHVNQQKQKFQQIATALVEKLFYGFMPVNDDVTMTTLTNDDDSDALAYFADGATAYQGIYYPGEFKSIHLSAGEAIIYLGEQ